jgi:hypothetical protein
MRKVSLKIISFSISFIKILLKIVKKLILFFTEKIRKRSLIEKLITFILFSALLTLVSINTQEFGSYRINGVDNSVDYFKVNEEWVWDQRGITLYVIFLSILSFMIFGGSKESKREHSDKESLEENSNEKSNVIDADFEVID